MVGTVVGLVQPGWLSLVHVSRATSTRLALSMSVREPSVLAATKRALFAAWWCMCACWWWLCMAPRPVSRAPIQSRCPCGSEARGSAGTTMLCETRVRVFSICRSDVKNYGVESVVDAIEG
jgi:hypothetical protein